jgi:GDPmannose 4,6-dehydratase
MKALISGITGQDGSYLAELLLDKGYEVHGIVRRSSSFNTGRIDHIFDRLKVHHGDLADATSIEKIVDISQPDECYNLAAQSHVRLSFDIPEYSADIDALGTLRILEALKGSRTRFYQASSSELFGKVLEVPQRETTPFYPRSPYGIAKLFGYWYTINAREQGLHASNGILFNHESPRRGETFVTHKITKAAARIKMGLQDKLLLGNLSARRDIGFAKEYVEAMWLMLQQSIASDYVIATGETHSVKEMLDVVFTHVGLDWTKYVGIDERYFRPTEVELLQGDATKAKKELGWEPKVKWDELLIMMVEEDLKELRK